ncbi:MAG: hypothetical protein WD960_01540 [Gemmatimonadota bacterium]
MLFSHGFGCDQAMWGGVAPAFEETHRIVLYDHTGAGGSDLQAWSPDRYVFRYMVLDATERRRYERDLLEAQRAADAALKRVRDLESLLPLCAWCRRVQGEKGTWLELEEFLDASGTQVTHAICGECATQMEK